MKKTKVIIVNCLDKKASYKDLKGKKFNVYGTIDDPSVTDGKYLTCVENSASINMFDVIFIR